MFLTDVYHSTIKCLSTRYKLKVWLKEGDRGIRQNPDTWLLLWGRMWWHYAGVAGLMIGSDEIWKEIKRQVLVNGGTLLSEILSYLITFTTTRDD